MVNRPELLATFMPAYLLAAAAGTACTPLLTRFIDKRKLLIVLMLASTVLSTVFLFVPSDQFVLMYTLQIALGLCLGPKSPLSFSMQAGSADYNEWRNGRRATGMTFAASSFAQKLGTAIAVAVMGALFSSLGYVPNVAQSAESQAGIVWLMSVIPAAFTLLAAVIMRRFTPSASSSVNPRLKAKAACTCRARCKLSSWPAAMPATKRRPLACNTD